MKTISRAEGLKIYNQLSALDDVEWQQVTRTITKKEICGDDGFTYTFLADKGELRKIEAYNHRELIEAYIE